MKSVMQCSKAELLEAVIAHFNHEYDVIVTSARAIYEAATHEDARAENKYDTRGLEASYLAESQSKRALGLGQTIKIYKAMEARTFSEDEAIALGALIALEDREGIHYYFLGPRGGGSELEFLNEKITIITGASPLGRSLLGSECGDEVSIGTGNTRRDLEVIGIR